MTFVAGQILRAQDLTEALFPSGGWDFYTPLNTNITVGNGDLQARWVQVGPLVFFQWHLTWGSTTSFTGAIAVGLPQPAASSAVPVSALSGRARDINGSFHAVTSGVAPGATTAGVQAGGAVNATTPFTWATGDQLAITGWYEAQA